MTQRERRWVVLVEDGTHSTVGRHTDPEEELLALVAEQLRSHGVGGWVAVLEGDYYQPNSVVSAMMVRELVPCSVSWKEAVDAFLQIRLKATAIV